MQGRGYVHALQASSSYFLKKNFRKLKFLKIFKISRIWIVQNLKDKNEFLLIFADFTNTVPTRFYWNVDLNPTKLRNYLNTNLLLQKYYDVPKQRFHSLIIFSRKNMQFIWCKTCFRKQAKENDEKDVFSETCLIEIIFKNRTSSTGFSKYKRLEINL